MKDKSIKEKLLIIYGKAGVLMILLLMCIILSITTDTFLTYRNIMNVLRQSSFYAMIAFGSMVTLIGGDFDLSPGSVMGLTSVLIGMAIQGTDQGVFIPILIALGVGLAVGMVNGILVAYCKVPAFIATLGMQELVRGLALYISDGRPINNLPEKFLFIGEGSIGIVPIPVIVLAVMTVIMWYLLTYTRIGRHIYAIGGNLQAALVAGINAKRLKLFTYLIAGVAAAISGLILTARISSGTPALGETYESKAITGCVIGGVSLSGGVGTVYGMLCGILIVGVLTNGMDLLNISGYMQRVAEGGIMIIAVLLDVVRERTASAA